MARLTDFHRQHSSRGSSRCSSSTTPPRSGSSSTTPPRAGSSSTTPPRAGLSSTTSPPPHVRVPRHVARLVTRIVARLVVDYFAYAARLGASARRAAHRLLSTTLTTSHDRVPRHVARLITRLVAPLVIDYSASRMLVVDYSASRMLVVDNSYSHRLVVDYFTSTTRPGASPRRATRTCGPSRGSSSTTPCAVTSSCGHAGSTSATLCVVTTCLTATVALLRVCRAMPRRRLPVASRRPFISTSFPN
jgi:hypothetical protein